MRPPPGCLSSGHERPKAGMHPRKRARALVRRLPVRPDRRHERSLPNRAQDASTIGNTRAALASGLVHVSVDLSMRANVSGSLRFMLFAEVGTLHPASSISLARLGRVGHSVGEIFLDRRSAPQTSRSASESQRVVQPAASTERPHASPCCRMLR